MITLEAQYVYLLIISNAIMLALACLCFTRFDRRCRQLEEFWGSPTGTVLNETQESNSSDYHKATQRLEQCIMQLQHALQAQQVKLDKPEASPVDRNPPIENAVRMARHGASVDDLTRKCGLNIGEARLMRKLHGQNQVAAGAMH